MNTEEAIKILKLHNNIITKISNKEYSITKPCKPAEEDRKQCVYDKKWEYLYKDTLSPRELIKLARVYTSDNNQTTKLKGLLKFEDKSKNRSATKRLINEDRTDEFSPKQKAKSGNIRNWD